MSHCNCKRCVTSNLPCLTLVCRDEKRKLYSRRRPVHAEADIDYINDANMKFNRKIERFYGEATSEIKQSLERGTAL